MVNELTNFRYELFVNGFIFSLPHRIGIPGAPYFFHFELVITLVVNSIDHPAIFPLGFKNPNVNNVGTYEMP